MKNLRTSIFETNSSSSHAYYYTNNYQTQTTYTGNTTSKTVIKPVEGKINYYNRRHVRIWKKITDAKLPILVTNQTKTITPVVVGKIHTIELTNLPATTSVGGTSVDLTEDNTPYSSDPYSQQLNSMYYFQWQYSTNNEKWYDLIGAVDPQYSVAYNQQNSSLNTPYYFRCLIYSNSDVTQAVVSDTYAIKFVLTEGA